MYRIFSCLAVVIVAILAGCTNLHTIEEGRAYRSAQPLAGDLQAWIETYGIHTVIRVRGGEPDGFWYEQSAAPLRDSGGELIALPMSSSRYPKKNELLRLCDAIENARPPMLIHCMHGADRTGLAAAIYVLQRGQGMVAARDQLRLFPYGHTGCFGTEHMDRVIDLYEPWDGKMPFTQWARQVYEPPAPDEDFEVSLARQQRLAREHSPIQ